MTHRGRWRRLRISVTVVSDTRTLKTDRSGKLITEILRSAGHEVMYGGIIGNMREEIRRSIEDAVERGVEVGVFCGGTGVGRRDLTVDTLAEVCEKEVNGFGEAFRSYSMREIGPFGMLSRAYMGIYRRVVLVALPGSPHAIETATKILIPVLCHVVEEVRR